MNVPQWNTYFLLHKTNNLTFPWDKETLKINFRLTPDTLIL